MMAMALTKQDFNFQKKIFLYIKKMTGMRGKGNPRDVLWRQCRKLNNSYPDHLISKQQPKKKASKKQSKKASKKKSKKASKKPKSKKATKKQSKKSTKKPKKSKKSKKSKKPFVPLSKPVLKTKKGHKPGKKWVGKKKPKHILQAAAWHEAGF